MLDHRDYMNMAMPEVIKELDALCEDLDQKHRQQRKIQFLLDIRGYFINNGIEGNYIEFGVFRGEMMYCAWKILEGTKCLKNYIGLDTFCGEPALDGLEQGQNPYTQEGSFESELETTRDFLSGYLGEKVKLIQGDFRDAIVLKESIEDNNKVALAVIDCNLTSSIKASIDFIVPHIVGGGVLFVDDFFFNMKKGNCPILDIIKDIEQKDNCRLVEFQTYAPFARAFFVIRDEGWSNE